MSEGDLVPGSVQHWIVRAEGHLEFARQPKPTGGFWEDLAFHAQQEAELSIKAVYQHRGVLFEFTHDLDKLIKGLKAAGVSMPIELSNVGDLTKFATRLRYPGQGPPTTEAEYRSAVCLAEGIVAWAKAEVCGSITP